MKIKLSSTVSNKADKLSYKDGKLKINGVEFDLLQLEYIELEEGAAQPNPYMDSEGIIHIHLTCDVSRQFLFIGDNYLKFYDKDLNGVLDDTEFTAFVKTWNKSEEKRREHHASILGK